MSEQTAPVVPQHAYPETLRESQHGIYDAALAELAGTSENSGRPLKELIPSIKERLLDQYSENYIYRVIRKASQSDQSPIQSGGPWGGYFVNAEKVVSDEERAAPPVEEPVKIGAASLYEKHLYPLVVFWMKYKKDYELVSSEVANFRAGGIWSNPDVVALDITDRIGLFDIEVVSAEIKSSEKNWRQWIFEAVSHRRFVDRSYFIFRSENGSSGIDQEIFVYAREVPCRYLCN